MHTAPKDRPILLAWPVVTPRRPIIGYWDDDTGWDSLEIEWHSLYCEFKEPPGPIGWMPIPEMPQIIRDRSGGDE